MFIFGRSSVLGNRDSSTKMTRNLINDDNWYSPHNGLYEASPRATTPQRHKQRDSWGDPIPFGIKSDISEPSRDGGTFDKRNFQQYQPGDIKYGVRGVFDDDWKRGGTSEMGRIGVLSGKDRGRRVSCGRDQTQSSFGPPDPHKSTFPTTSRRRSTFSSGNSLPVPNYTPLYGVSGGVGESPVPQRPAQKDVNRISLGSIFTFGSKMRMSSPSRAMDDDRKEREENIGVRSTSNLEKGRVHKPSYHEKHSKRNNKQIEYSALSNEKEDYRDYYNSLYSTLVVDEDNGTPKKGPRHRRSPERFRHPVSTPHDSRVEKDGQLRPRAGSRQNLAIASVGHPYAPYAHQGQDRHVQGVRDERLPSPTPDDTPPIPHQNHPYNQARPVYTRHPYGQSSVSTGASSPSHTTAVKRGSGQSEHHGECQHLISHVNKIAVAPGIGIASTGVGGVGLEPGIHGKKLKVSRSTPNFHHTQIIDFPNYTSGPSNEIPRSAPPVPLLHMKQLPPPKPKDRWLSAETWCDALLFPRPKLKLKQGKNATIFSQGDESFIGGPVPSGSGRIISPPSSPVVGEWDIEINGEEAQLQSILRDQQAEGSGEGGAVQKQRQPGIPSRVLAHSKSVELHKKSGKEKSGYISDVESRAVRQGKAKAVPAIRDGRDTQEIVPPSLAPDLDEVLSEGRLLDEERQAWQTLAVNSFGNKRSRSLSRTRTKSLTRKGRSTMRRKERDTGADESDGQVGEYERGGQSSFEYLAAQACLGNQTLSATFIQPSPNADDTKASGVHSHSNSYSTNARTTTKSSKSLPKPHSRNNSSGNSGVNAGRISVSKLCGSMGLDMDLDSDHGERANLVSHTTTHCANVRMAPDLEDALRRHGTKVIRLADPAHIPVDEGTPISQPVSPNPLGTQNQRKTPSPDLSVSNLSAISHSKVGIAIGTPPEEAGGASPVIIPAGPMAVSASYMPSHPYAQGSLSFGRERPIESCDPPGISSSKVPPLTEILARFKVPSHPYALSSGKTGQEQSIQPSSQVGIDVTRDSYLSANGLVGHFRSDDRPDPSRMWAQLSPDVVREILPGDLQYSPYNSVLKGIEKLEGTKNSGHRREDERMKSIHDTAGVAEALLSATTYERDGKVLHEKHKDDDRIIEQVDIPETMHPNETDLLIALSDLRKHSHAPSPHTISSSRLGGVAKSASTRSGSLDDLETASHSPTSGSPSPGFRVLGSPNDLDSYQDLFYQPSTTNIQDSPASPDGTPNVMSWDAAVRNRRTGSSLTSLARQLGEEYEALASVDANRVSGMPLLGARSHHSGLSSEGNLQFVLEEMAPADSLHGTPNETVHVFKSANLPEDVYSLQASSITDGNGEDDDPTGLLRLGTVESLSTTAAVDVEHRISFNGETIFDYEDQDAPAVGLSTAIEQPGSVISRRDLLPMGLSSQRPLTQVTRSSCMTTSDLSRMSGLSDFPSPPKIIYSEATLPTRHFDGELRGDVPQPNTEYVEPPSNGPARSPVMSSKLLSQVGHVEFGVDQSAVELAKSLSSPEPM